MREWLEQEGTKREHDLEKFNGMLKMFHWNVSFLQKEEAYISFLASHSFQRDILTSDDTSWLNIRKEEKRQEQK